MFPNETPSNEEVGGDRVRRTSMPRLLFLSAVFGALWLILTGHEDPSSWIVGLPAVVAATWAHERLSPHDGPRLSVIDGVRLIPFFFRESFMGGIDVARRVVGPRLDVAPGFVDYRLGLTLRSARVFFVDLVSLIPGTLCADVRGNTLLAGDAAGAFVTTVAGSPAIELVGYRGAVNDQAAVEAFLDAAADTVTPPANGLSTLAAGTVSGRATPCPQP